MTKLVQEIKKIMKNNIWLVLATSDDDNQPQSSVVMYKSDGNHLYFTTSSSSLKVRNIKKNNKVAVTIPFRKNLLHKLIPAPPAEIHFRATAHIISVDEEETKRNLAEFIEHAKENDLLEDTVCVKLIPSKRITTYGVGIKLLDMRFPNKARNSVNLE